MSLRHTQQHFAEALLNGDIDYTLETTLSAYSRDELKARLSIYSNNVFYSLCDALRHTYSTVNSLVGEEFFDALAKQYTLKYPPQKASMIFFGGHFSRFIFNFEHTQELPYLADIATLDWHNHLAYHAEEASVLSPNDFSALPHQRLINSRFQFHPSCFLLRSDYAIFTIRSVATASSEDSTSVRYDCPENCLTVRPDAEVLTLQLDEEVAVFFEQLLAGVSLVAALEKTIETYEHFNPSNAVAFLTSSQTAIKILTETEGNPQ